MATEVVFPHFIPDCRPSSDWTVGPSALDRRLQAIEERLGKIEELLTRDNPAGDR